MNLYGKCILKQDKLKARPSMCKNTESWFINELVDLTSTKLSQSCLIEKVSSQRHRCQVEEINFKLQAVKFLQKDDLD